MNVLGTQFESKQTRDRFNEKGITRGVGGKGNEGGQRGLGGSWGLLKKRRHPRLRII